MEINLIELAQKFSTEETAREFLEGIRWPSGAACPHCGSVKVYRLEPKPTSKTPGRKGLWKCGDCRKQFTVTVGTIFEGSHIPLHKWVMAFYVMCASKKGVSALQLQGMLALGSYRAAWFMCHRIRHALSDPDQGAMLSGTVEADETWIGGKAKNMHASKRKQIGGRGTAGKTPIFALVERDGRLRGRTVATVNGENLKQIMRENVSPQARIMTDESGAYLGLAHEFASHESVVHGKGEYVRGDVYINTLEGAFSLFKRQIVGAHHHVSIQHLDRYWTEFEFKYNARKVDAGQRTILAIEAAEGKRLMYS